MENCNPLIKSFDSGPDSFTLRSLARVATESSSINFERGIDWDYIYYLLTKYHQDNQIYLDEVLPDTPLEDLGLNSPQRLRNLAYPLSEFLEIEGFPVMIDPDYLSAEIDLSGAADQLARLIAILILDLGSE